MTRNGENSRPDLLEVIYGYVSDHTPSPSEEQVQLGKQESAHVASVLPVVLTELPFELDLGYAPDTPVFWSDPDDPSLLVRQIGESQVRGCFIDGEFVPLS